eukprot:scaffold5212_cov78-Skeletonema_dohrnii-CCMP3373.AAC.2
MTTITSRIPASEAEEGISSSKAASSSTSPRRSKSDFPIKLYAMLELADTIPEFAQAVTWLPHGRAFRILDKDTFMKEVVPVFFNQTKIRSFNRQLHLWGFRRNDDRRILNFDDLPPLPIPGKQPSAVLNEMENAILKIHSSSIANGDLKMSTLFHASFSDATGHRSKSPCELNVELNLDELFTSPSSLLPASNVSQGVPIPFLRSHLPLQANTSDSMTYTNQASAEGTSRQVKSHVMLQAEFNDLCFGPLKHRIEDFEPLPFCIDNDPCFSDDFANFIEGAIQLIER